MKKITLISGKEALPVGAFDFACQLNKHEPILLDGVFLPAFNFWDSMLYFPYAMTVPAPYYPPVAADEETTAIAEFGRRCILNGIDHRIHEKVYEDIPAELRMESRFSDLLLCSAASLQQQLEDVVAEAYYKQTLHRTECPVIVFPERACPVKRIVLAYDGSAASVYAIRQFALLFPQLSALETDLIYMAPDATEPIPEMSRIEELAARHFPNLNLVKLDIDPETYFPTWLSETRNALLVAGASGSGGFVEFFRKNFIQDIVNEQMLPVFIAHH